MTTIPCEPPAAEVRSSVAVAAASLGQDSDHAAVGHEQDGEIVVCRLDQSRRSSDDAGVHGIVRLPSRGSLEFVAMPRVEGAGVALLDLVDVEALELPARALTKIGMRREADVERVGDDSGRMRSAPEIAGMHLDAAEPVGGERRGSGSSLSHSLTRERAIRPPLPAAVAVPVGLAVADEEHASHVGSEADGDGGSAMEWARTGLGLTMVATTPRIDRRFE